MSSSCPNIVLQMPTTELAPTEALHCQDISSLQQLSTKLTLKQRSVCGHMGKKE